MEIDGDLNEINLNTLFGSNVVIVQLLKTEIFNNKNIDFKINIHATKFIKTLILKILI